MVGFFRYLIDRFKHMLLAHAAADAESDLAIHNADRKVALLEAAKKHDEAGFKDVAADLRAQASAITPDKPMQMALPSARYAESQQSQPLALEAPKTPTPPEPAKKKGRSI